MNGLGGTCSFIFHSKLDVFDWRKKKFSQKFSYQQTPLERTQRALTDSNNQLFYYSFPSHAGMCSLNHSIRNRFSVVAANKIFMSILSFVKIDNITNAQWLHFIFDTETGIWINLIGRRVFVWIEESLKILGILDFRKYYSQPKGAFNSTINVNCLYIYSFSKSWNFWKVHRYHQSIFKFTICRLDPFQSMFVTTQHNLRNSSRYFAEIYVWNVPFHDHTGFFISSAVNDVSTN